ncbi:MAG: hypothetical protein NC225_12195 [Clostridium sp.]|nr:hypothetical protein [Clostridium sp.]MCM1400229.1 hypothetical protein [Clostridium sp.]MCM1460318.1 hypothetical protein [Bacteroides sp.]
MKKIKKLIKKLNNRGSSLVMVVVALGFIGIIVGALLMFAGYAYKQKLQDLNARDNFYYVEQAMQEIYAGVGSKTVEDMQDAYIYTVENMVRYDLNSNSYVTIGDEAANDMFKQQFMHNLDQNTFFDSANVATELSKYITNSSVQLDMSKVFVDDTDRDVNGNLKSLTIKNITLTRTQEYNRSQANGYFTQSISTDIVIGEPDFTVRFNSTGSDYPKLFDFSLVADMGLEINQPAGNPLTITGNVYAAADYYNKKYNESTYVDTVTDAHKAFTQTINGTAITYTHGSVTSKKYDAGAAGNTYYNVYSSINDPEIAGERDYYNGVNQRSMYSGLYINGSSVSILADTVIVPGTIAVMNSGDLTLYGKTGKSTSESEVWTDNIVLGGYSTRTITQNGSDNQSIKYNGSTALLRADVYVKDDTEINATGAYFQLKGSYFGYGDSTAKDTREFIPTVDPDNFQIEEADGTRYNRGHYNSSAIIINGEKSTLDLKEAEAIYLAGRSYIELSKQINETDLTVNVGDGTTGSTSQDVVKQTYQFMPTTSDIKSLNDTTDTTYLRDYRTGESISLKSNQKAYVPVMYTGMPTAVTNSTGTQVIYYEAKLHTALKGSVLFEKYFPTSVFEKRIDGVSDVYIPCIMQEVSGKKYYYYDFTSCYNRIAAVDSAFKSQYTTDRMYAAAFIADYVKELKDPNSNIAQYLVDITNYEDFEAGEILLPTMNDAMDASSATVYSSGAITSKSGSTFDMITPGTMADAQALLAAPQVADYTGASSNITTDFDGSYTNALSLSDNLDLEYNFVKWNLGHLDKNLDADERTYIEALLADSDFGEASITPINKYINIRTIGTDPTYKDLRPAKGTETGNEATVLKLASGYSVYINDGVSTGASDPAYVTIEAGTSGVVKGIVIAKGDVYFADNVRSFEGLIVSGGKVYINNQLQSFTASPEICRAIIRECQLSSEDKCKYVLSLFKAYEGSSVVALDPADTSAKTIDTIDYSDVVSFDNWMKNVE